MTARLTMMLTALLAIAAIAAGCGSDDDSSSASASSLSETFVKQANAACQKNRAQSFQEVEDYARKHRSEGSEEEVTNDGLTSVVLSIYTADAAAIRSLEVSSDDEEAVEAIVSAQQQALDKAKQKQKKAKSPAEIEALFTDAEKVLSRYGLTRCTTET